MAFEQDGEKNRYAPDYDKCDHYPWGNVENFAAKDPPVEKKDR